MIIKFFQKRIEKKKKKLKHIIEDRLCQNYVSKLSEYSTFALKLQTKDIFCFLSELSQYSKELSNEVKNYHSNSFDNSKQVFLTYLKNNKQKIPLINLKQFFKSTNLDKKSILFKYSRYIHTFYMLLLTFFGKHSDRPEGKVDEEK